MNITERFVIKVTTKLFLRWPLLWPLPVSGLIQQTTNWWYFFVIFPRKQVLKLHANCLHWIWHVMQIVSFGDNLHEISKPVFWEKIRKNISIYRLLKILPRVLSVSHFPSFLFKTIQTDLQGLTDSDKWAGEQHFLPDCMCAQRRRSVWW